MKCVVLDEGLSETSEEDGHIIVQILRMVSQNKTSHYFTVVL